MGFFICQSQIFAELSHSAIKTLPQRTINRLLFAAATLHWRPVDSNG